MRLLAHWLPVLAALAISVALAWPEEAAPGGAKVGGLSEPAPARELRLLIAAGVSANEVTGPVLVRGAAPHEERPELQQAVVTVLGSGERARVGLPVRIWDPRQGSRARHLLTDGGGKVSLGKIPLDGSVRVEVLDRWVPGALSSDALDSEQLASGARAMRVLLAASIVEVETTLQCRANMALEVRLEDAVSGDRLGGIAYSDVRDEDGKALTGLLPGAHRQAGIGFPDEPLEGHVVWGPSSWKTRVSRYTSRLTMVCPLRREARVVVYAQEHDGTPTERALIHGFSIAGRRFATEVRSTPHRGGFLVRDIPFLRDEVLGVVVVRPPVPVPEEEIVEEIEEEYLIEEEPDSEEDDDRIGSWLDPDVALGEGRLPHEWAQRLVITAVFPPPNTELGGFRSRGGMSSYSCGSGCRRARKSPSGRVLVTVIRRSGAPAVGAQVCVGRVRGRTDLQGRATFEGVRVGTRVLFLNEPGLVPTRREVVVVAHRTQRVTLREAAGASVKIQVVDEAGEGLPYATLALPSGAGWVDLEGGVQRIDPFTDREGRRSLRHFPQGTWTFKAAYGSRRGEARVDLKHGAVQTVTITLK